MGVVWRATDLLLDRVVALKQVRLAGLAAGETEAARTRVMREARVAARLHHPNAVTIFDVVEVDGEPWLVLEYVPSRSLAEVLDEWGVLAPAVVARVGVAVADALVAAHAAGIVHRDVKPANILLGDAGAVKLTDFGISRLAGDVTLTAAGLLIGTPAYLPPEVARGGEATQASDVFCLGATLYAAVEGRPVWGSGAETNILLLLRMAGEGVISPPQRAAELAGPLIRMLDPDPARRPSAAAARELLGTMSRPDGPSPPAAPPVTIVGSRLPGEQTFVPRTPQQAPSWTPPPPSLPQPSLPPQRPPRPRRRLLLPLSVVVVAALVGAILLAVRGGVFPGQGSAAGTTTSPAACDTSRRTLVVGMIVPLTGALSSLGLGMRNAADLAVDQANAACAVPGYRLRLQAEDDQATPQIAGQAATSLAANPDVVGVVGTLNSSTSQAVQPVLAASDTVQVSPANTNPTLTLGADAASPKRPFPTYFRVATTDLVQGPFAAEYLVKTAGKKKAVVIDDSSTYGIQLADTFTQRFTALGATIAAREKVGGSDTDFSGVISRIKSQQPDSVYYGGVYPGGGPLSGQLAAAGLTVPVVGGDGLVDQQFVALGGRNGDLATNVGAPTSELPGGARFDADYAAAKYAEPAQAFGVSTYDATRVIIGALTRTLASSAYGTGTRRALIAAVQATDMDGVTGRIAFDGFGDTTNRLLTVYAVQNGQWATVPGSTRSYSG